MAIAVTSIKQVIRLELELSMEDARALKALVQNSHMPAEDDVTANIRRAIFTALRDAGA